jgi:hypothetical protein
MLVPVKSGDCLIYMVFPESDALKLEVTLFGIRTG